MFVDDRTCDDCERRHVMCLICVLPEGYEAICRECIDKLFGPAHVCLGAPGSGPFCGSCGLDMREPTATAQTAPTPTRLQR